MKKDCSNCRWFEVIPDWFPDNGKNYYCNKEESDHSGYIGKSFFKSDILFVKEEKECCEVRDDN